MGKTKQLIDLDILFSEIIIYLIRQGFNSDEVGNMTLNKLLICYHICQRQKNEDDISSIYLINAGTNASGKELKKISSEIQTYPDR